MLSQEEQKQFFTLLAKVLLSNSNAIVDNKIAPPDNKKIKFVDDAKYDDSFENINYKDMVSTLINELDNKLIERNNTI